MFLDRLNAEEKKAFIALARELIAVDARLADKELELMESMLLETGVAASEELPSGDRGSILGVFKSKQAQVIVLLGLLRLAWADDEYSTVEKDIVQDAAKAFGVAEEKLVQMEKWVLGKEPQERDAEAFWQD